MTHHAHEKNGFVVKGLPDKKKAGSVADKNKSEKLELAKGGKHDYEPGLAGKHKLSGSIKPNPNDPKTWDM